MALEDFAAEMDRCSQCSYCKWIPFDQMKSWRFAKNCPSISYHNFNSNSRFGIVYHPSVSPRAQKTGLRVGVLASALQNEACGFSQNGKQR
jgi:hypothetical protein